MHSGFFLIVAVVVSLSSGWTAAEPLFIPTETSSFTDEFLTGPTYTFNVSGNANQSVWVGRVQALSASWENRTMIYSITNSSSENRVSINSATGDLQVIARNDQHFGNVVVVYVKAEEEAQAEVNGSLIMLDMPAMAKVVIYINAPKGTQSVRQNITFSLAVRYTVLIGDVIGQIQLMNREMAASIGATYWTSTAWVRNPLTGENYGEIRAFDIYPHTGDLSVKMFLAEFNQRRFDLTVTARNSQLIEVAGSQVFAWVYDEPQEIQITLGVSPSSLTAYGYGNLTEMFSAALGGRVALGKVSGAGKDETSLERTVMRLIVLDRSERYILESGQVISNLNRSSTGFMELDQLLLVRNIQGAIRPASRSDVSLPAIILIAICSLLLVAILLVLCIFCRMKQRYSKDKIAEKRLVIPVPIHKPPVYASPRRPASLISGTNKSITSDPVMSTSSATLPAPYIYGSTGNPMGSFRSASVAPPTRGSRQPSTYEEQELSLSMGSDIESGHNHLENKRSNDTTHSGASGQSRAAEGVYRMRSPTRALPVGSPPKTYF